MADFILDDVNELLLKDIGDPKILARIKRAAEGGEVISVYERDYVKNLVDTQLRKKPTLPPKKETPKEKSPTIFEQKTIIEKPIARETEKKQIFVSKISNEKKTKLAFGIGAIALAVILIIGISQSGISEFDSDDSVTPKPQTKTTGFVIETDASSYSKGDIISISGSSNPPSDNVVNLSIKNPNGDVIWSENVKLKSNNSYSTLAIAGGSGWESGGKYFLTGKNGSLSTEVSFNFKN